MGSPRVGYKKRVRQLTRVLDLVSKSRHFVRLCTDLTDDSQPNSSKYR